ncbi:MAG: hypothetical protein AAF607_02115 [Pseudomonadota bacterium]
MKFLICFSAWLVAAATAQAASITVSEQGRPSGDVNFVDYSNSRPGQNITDTLPGGTLGFGDTITMIGQNNIAADWVQIVSAGPFIITLDSFSGTVRNFLLEGGPSNANLAVNGVTGPQFLFSALDPGTYSFGVSRDMPGARGLAVFDLTISSGTRVVPLPASAVLLAPILTGFAFIRRKQQAFDDS